MRPRLVGFTTILTIFLVGCLPSKTALYIKDTEKTASAVIETNPTTKTTQPTTTVTLLPTETPSPVLSPTSTETPIRTEMPTPEHVLVQVGHVRAYADELMGGKLGPEDDVNFWYRERILKGLYNMTELSGNIDKLKKVNGAGFNDAQAFVDYAMVPGNLVTGLYLPSSVYYKGGPGYFSALEANAVMKPVNGDFDLSVLEVGVLGREETIARYRADVEVMKSIGDADAVAKDSRLFSLGCGYNCNGWFQLQGANAVNYLTLEVGSLHEGSGNIRNGLIQEGINDLGHTQEENAMAVNQVLNLLGFAMVKQAEPGSVWNLSSRTEFLLMNPIFANPGISKSMLTKPAVVVP
jgi:hypothetical protein